MPSIFFLLHHLRFESCNWERNFSKIFARNSIWKAAENSYKIAKKCKKVAVCVRNKLRGFSNSSGPKMHLKFRQVFTGSFLRKMLEPLKNTVLPKIKLLTIQHVYLTDSYIGFTLKMESVSKNTIFGLKMMVKSGPEKFILKSLHAGR